MRGAKLAAPGIAKAALQTRGGELPGRELRLAAREWAVQFAVSVGAGDGGHRGARTELHPLQVDLTQPVVWRKRSLIHLN